MTAHWTTDDNGDLEFADDNGRLWTLTAAMLGDLVWTAETGQAATAVAALVADVRAARLVDDMVRVIRRMARGWHVMGDLAGDWWAHPRYHDKPDDRRLSPGEVAALHHARQEGP